MRPPALLSTRLIRDRWSIAIKSLDLGKMSALPLALKVILNADYLAGAGFFHHIDPCRFAYSHYCDRIMLKPVLIKETSSLDPLGNVSTVFFVEAFSLRVANRRRERKFKTS